MDSVRDGSSYSIPIYFKDQANDLKNIEAEANQALQNIRSLYIEIMHPNELDDLKSDSNSSSASSPSSLKNRKRCSAEDLTKFSKTTNKFYFDSQALIVHCSTCYSHSSNITNLNSSDGVELEDQSLHFETQCHCAHHSNKNSTKNLASSPKITVPQPFALSGFDEKRLEAKQIKLDKIRNELKNQNEKELKVKITSKPVPKHTNLPLYNEMVKKTEQRKTERKYECLKVIGKGSKPVYHNDPLNIKRKSKSASNINNIESKSTFKATPIPKNILSDKVSEKLKNKEEVRKMLIAHRAEEMLKQSMSPISKKHVSKSYSTLNLNDYIKDNPTDKSSKPNITAITNRLYTKKCKETIENWNDKVMRYCYKENDSKTKTNLFHKLKPEPKQILPFLYYPVRMSTATSLRNKQIR